MVIDVTIAADRNVTEKEGEQKLKNKTLCIETQKLWTTTTTTNNNNNYLLQLG